MLDDDPFAKEVQVNNIPSPCIGQCSLDEQDVCMGCWRSLGEIKQWSVVNDAIRQKFLANAKLRQQHALLLADIEQRHAQLYFVTN